MSAELLSETHGEPMEVTDGHGEIRQNVFGRDSSVTTENKSLAVISLHQPANHLQGLAGAPVEATANSRRYLSWSYARLNNAADSVLAMLIERGVRRGSTVALFVYSGVEWYIMLWASLKLGAVFVPLDPTSLKRAEELLYLFNLIRPTAVLVNENAGCQILDESEFSEKLLVKLTTGLDTEQPPHGWMKLDDVPNYISKAGPPFDLEQPDEDDIATILFTSGTTGKPKGCPHTYRSLNSVAISRYERNINANSKVLCNSMPFRAIYTNYTIPTFSAGGTVVLPAPSFSAPTTLHALQTESCTHITAVPSQVIAFAAATRDNPQNNPQLRLTVAGDFITADLVSKARTALNPGEIYNNYGATEAGGSNIQCRLWPPSPSTSPVSDPPSDPDGSAVPTTSSPILPVGKSCPTRSARICSPSPSPSPPFNPLPRNTPGEIHLSASSIITSYYPATISPTSFYTDPPPCLSSNGPGPGRAWYRTGDRAIMSPDGTITILGRYKDVISRAGVKLSPAVIEVCLTSQSQSLPSKPNLNLKIESACCIPLPSSTYGSVPVAVVELSHSHPPSSSLLHLTEKEREEAESGWKEKVRRECGEEYVPERIFLLGEVMGEGEGEGGGWPLNATGKVVRGVVGERVREVMGR
ncbi:MAG: hypothetical protein Q9227_000456 [Pyrenula ochraceoflavens]